MIANRPVWVTIPTIGHSPYLIPLINEIERDRVVDKIILTVNLEEYVEPIQDFFRFGEPTIEILETWQLGKSIYKGWNTSIEMARKENAWLAVLNDDIRLLETDAISTVVSLLSKNTSYAIAGLNWQEATKDTKPTEADLRSVRGSYRHHGVGGFAWACDPHKIDTVPDDLVHWGGDDYIFFRAERAGHRLGISTHVHVEHPSPETTSVCQPWTYEERIKDREVFNKYFPGQSW